jgi:hypothetical protein
MNSVVAPRSSADTLAAVLHARLGASDDVVLRGAAAAYQQHLDTSLTHVEASVACLPFYDTQALTRVAAITHCGGSGSLLLASYLDNHPEILMLPFLAGMEIYPFFSKYASLTIWEKLIAYPEFSALIAMSDGHFFQKPNPVGDFAIEAPRYYAAILALLRIHGSNPPEWLSTRRGFFQALHVVYSIALGRRPANPRPVMVYAQHWYSDDHAAQLVEDFPDAKFIHTVRDPIAGLDSWYDRKMETGLYQCDYKPELLTEFLDPAVSATRDLVKLPWDQGHIGMHERSVAVRFEDMHLAPEALMNSVAQLLNIEFAPSLLLSTWNGNPFVIVVRGKSWCGPNPANAQRRSKNLDAVDRLLIFSLQHENFVAWQYPYPAMLRRRWLRLVLVALCAAKPMKLEIANARAIWRLQVLPALRSGRYRFALRAPLFLLRRRLRMMWLMTLETKRLSGRRRPVLQRL